MRKFLRKISGKKEPPKAPLFNESPKTATLLNAEVNDVVELHLPNDSVSEDAFMLVTKVIRCDGGGNQWVEVLVEGDQRKIWLEYSEQNGEPFLTYNDAAIGPRAPESIGIEPDDLTILDEEQSTNNGLMIEGRRFTYLNSYECKRIDTADYRTSMAWVWDLHADDGEHTISVSKRRDAPYECFVSQVLDPHYAQLRKAA